jgi:hypothetical protein
VLIGAWVALPQLPMPSTRATPSAYARVLAKGRGPVLVLPSIAGAFRLDAHALADQVFHHRPLVNGPPCPRRPPPPSPGSRWAPGPRSTTVFGCETTPGARFDGDVAAALAPLREIGLDRVYLDAAVLGAHPDDATDYLGCVGSLLGVPTADGPYLVYDLKRAIRVDRPPRTAGSAPPPAGPAPEPAPTDPSGPAAPAR